MLTPILQVLASPPRYPKSERTAPGPTSPLSRGIIDNYDGPEIPDYEELDRLHERPSVEEDRGEGPSGSTATAPVAGMGFSRPNPREFIDILQDEGDIRPAR